MTDKSTLDEAKVRVKKQTEYLEMLRKDYADIHWRIRVLEQLFLAVGLAIEDAER